VVAHQIVRLGHVVELDRQVLLVGERAEARQTVFTENDRAL
jgi:hypothetical protein